MFTSNVQLTYDSRHSTARFIFKLLLALPLIDQSLCFLRECLNSLGYLLTSLILINLKVLLNGFKLRVYVISLSFLPSVFSFAFINT